MKDSVNAKTAFFANLSVIAVALLLGITLVKDHWLGDRQTQRAPIAPQIPFRGTHATPTAQSPAPGTHVTLSGVDWSAHHNTLVFVLSTTCHFCSKSAPFYQQVLRTMSLLPDFTVIAVLPQDVKESKAYLDKLGIHIDKVIQSRLDSIGVRGTPTVFWLDNKGVVRKSWVGLLSEFQQSDLLNSVTNSASHS